MTIRCEDNTHAPEQNAKVQNTGVRFSAKSEIPVISRNLFRRGGINPFRAAVPFWGQTSLNLSVSSPKRDCGSEKG